MTRCPLLRTHFLDPSTCASLLAKGCSSCLHLKSRWTRDATTINIQRQSQDLWADLISQLLAQHPWGPCACSRIPRDVRVLCTPRRPHYAPLAAALFAKFRALASVKMGGKVILTEWQTSATLSFATRMTAPYFTVVTEFLNHCQ